MKIPSRAARSSRASAIDKLPAFNYSFGGKKPMDLIHLLIYLLILTLFFGAVWYALQQIPLPPPVRVVVVLIFCLILILVLLSFIGYLPLRVAGLSPAIPLRLADLSSAIPLQVASPGAAIGRPAPWAAIPA
jgi:hypothetical protein